MNTATFAKTIGLVKYEKPVKIEAGNTPNFDYGKVFTVGRTSTAMKMYYQYTGFGAPNLTGELQEVAFEPAYELAPLTLTAIKYTKGFVVSEELEEDNTQIPDLLGSWAKSVGHGMAYAKEYSAASVFVNGFTDSAAYRGWDSKPLFSTTHATTSGTTINNNFGPTSMSIDTIYDMLKYFLYQIYDESGLPITDTPAQLLYHPSNQDVVEYVFKSPGRWDSPDRSANILADKGLELIPSRLLPTTAFFVLGSMEKDFLHFDMKKDVTVAWKDAFVVIGRLCRTHMRYLFGFTDYRFAVGNAGS